MKSIGSYEAKSHFSQVLEEVIAGETVTVTKNGRPVARIVPLETRPERIDRLIEAGRKMRERTDARFTASELRQLMEEGRR